LKPKRIIKSLVTNRLISKDLWEVYRALRKRKTKNILLKLIELMRSQPYLYPSQGSKAIIDGLLSKIEASSIRVFTNSSVERVVVNESGSLNVCWIGRQDFLCKYIVTGQNVKFDVSVDGKSLNFDRERQSYVHILLRIKGKKNNRSLTLTLTRTH